MKEKRARQLREIISKAAQSLDDESAMLVPNLYDEWSPSIEYTAGDKIMHNGQLYKVLQTHLSQNGWSPDEVPALFATVREEGVIEEWHQPDSTNPYMSGERVLFDGLVYESTIDNNVWSPTAYPAGWLLIRN